MVWKNEEESDSGHTVSAFYKKSVVTYMNDEIGIEILYDNI